jgi:hypothetical protein
MIDERPAIIRIVVDGGRIPHDDDACNDGRIDVWQSQRLFQRHPADMM